MQGVAQAFESLKTYGSNEKQKRQRLELIAAQRGPRSPDMHRVCSAVQGGGARARHYDCHMGC